MKSFSLIFFIFLLSFIHSTQCSTYNYTLLVQVDLTDVNYKHTGLYPTIAISSMNPKGLNYSLSSEINTMYSVSSSYFEIYGLPTSVVISMATGDLYQCGSNIWSTIAYLNINTNHINSGSINATAIIQYNYYSTTNYYFVVSNYTSQSVSCFNGMPCILKTSQNIVISLTVVKKLYLDIDQLIPMIINFPTSTYTVNWAPTFFSKSLVPMQSGYQSNNNKFLIGFDIPLNPSNYSTQMYVISTGGPYRTFQCGPKYQSNFIPTFLFRFNFIFNSKNYSLQVTEYYSWNQVTTIKSINATTITCNYGMLCDYFISGDGSSQNGYDFYINILSTP